MPTITAEEAAAFRIAAQKYMPPCDDVTCVNVFRTGAWAAYTTYAVCAQCAARAPDIFKLGLTYNPWGLKQSKAEVIAMNKTRKSRSVTYLVVHCLRERSSRPSW